MSDSTSNLKDRIEAMSRGDRELPQSLDPRFFGAALGGVILLSGALVVACSEVTGPHLEEGASPAQDPPPPEPSVARGSPEAAGEPTHGERTPPPPPEDRSEPEVFVAVEQMPELIGGIRGLQEEIRYPDMARRAGIEGRVIVQFEVSRRGDAENATILRGIGAGCDAEALRVVRAAEFRPGLQRGEPVRVKMSLPITFRLGPE